LFLNDIAYRAVFMVRKVRKRRAKYVRDDTLKASWRRFRYKHNAFHAGQKRANARQERPTPGGQPAIASNFSVLNQWRRNWPAPCDGLPEEPGAAGAAHH
jgi:hypothetical protein